MVRSMYAGVAGMKANQTRMDVIGNNIANANTYGFKSSRAPFRDMYYQQIRGASGGSATRGGTNPSMVGYGSQIASIDLLMTQSSFTSTGNPLDVAIAGEGFLQVMDPDGNIYYTKAGMLDIDQATGALIDSNGNFVLGTSATDGKLDSTEPGSNKILIQVAPVQASVGKVETEISGKKLTITSTNQNKSANVSFTFTKTTELPDGKDVVAIMDGTSSAINIQINANSSFASMADLQKAINNAITEANGGAHAGGDFVFSMQPDPFADGPLTGAQIIDTATADYDGGKIDLVAPGTDVSADGSFLGGFKIVETGLRFSGEGDVSVEVTDSADPEGYNVTVTTAGGATYTGFISQERADISSGSGQVLLKNASGDANDTITLSYPNTTDIEANLNKNVTIGTATASQPSKELGWGKGTFTLTGGLSSPSRMWATSPVFPSVRTAPSWVLPLPVCRYWAGSTWLPSPTRKA